MYTDDYVGELEHRVKNEEKVAELNKRQKTTNPDDGFSAFMACLFFLGVPVLSGCYLFMNALTSCNSYLEMPRKQKQLAITANMSAHEIEVRETASLALYIQQNSTGSIDENTGKDLYQAMAKYHIPKEQVVSTLEKIASSSATWCKPDVIESWTAFYVSELKKNNVPQERWNELVDAAKEMPYDQPYPKTLVTYALKLVIPTKETKK